MNIRDNLGNYTDHAMDAVDDFRLTDLSEIINVIINPDSNPIISGIVDKYRNILGYDGAIYMAMGSFFRNNWAFANNSNLRVPNLSKMIKEANANGIRPETFQITAICIFYSTDTGVSVPTVWLDDDMSSIAIDISSWVGDNWKMLKGIYKDRAFHAISAKVHEECNKEIHRLGY